MLSTALSGQAAAITPALIAAISSFIVLVLTVSVAQIRFLYERKAERETLLNALFGEVANVCEHYLYVQQEFSVADSWEHESKLERLRLAQYGDMMTTENFGRYGFLDAEDLRLLLQMRLRIRNNDLILEGMVKRLERGDSVGVHRVPARAHYALLTANDVMIRLAAKRTRLQLTLEGLRREVPGIQESNSKD